MSTATTAAATERRGSLRERLGLYSLGAATVATGLFAGLIWTFAVAIDRAEERLGASAYATWRQYLIKDLDRGILPVLIFTALAPLVALVALAHRRSSTAWRVTLAAYVVYLLGVMVYTLTLNVPINNAMLDWNAASPPADWADQRDRWDQLNTVRTFVTIGAFVAYLVGFALLVRDRTLETVRGVRF